MKTCKKCNKQFKSYTYINGKHYSLTGRSYCLDCSPHGKRNGYFLRKEKTKETLDGKPGKICPICNKIQNKYWKNNVCTTCRAAYLRHKNKMKLKQNAGGKCVKCGFDNINILQFHHIDSDKKSFTISHFYHSKNFKSLEIETKKCILLCPNCHAMEHIKGIEHIISYYNKQCGILDSNQ